MKVFFTQKKLLFSFFIFLAINSIGQSLRFTDTSFVNLGNASSLHLTNFTIEARIKIEGYGLRSPQKILLKTGSWSLNNSNCMVRSNKLILI
jgi:hypothetical protein